MATQQSGRDTTASWAPVQRAAAVVGVLFLLPGILGFIPGITTHFEMLSFAGHESGAKLLGLFARPSPPDLVRWRLLPRQKPAPLPAQHFGPQIGE
jgi:Domain of unknown function (DUF4383)